VTIRHTKACRVERAIGVMAAGTMALIFMWGLLFFSGCAPVQVKPGCENSMQSQPGIDIAMAAGVIGLSEYLLRNPDDRLDARKAVQAAIIVLEQEVVTMDLLVSALQKGISSREVRARLGYVAIFGRGRTSGTALDSCDRKYLLAHFQELRGMI